MSVREIIDKFPAPDDLLCDPWINSKWMKQYSEALKELIDLAPSSMISEADVKAAYLNEFYEQPTIEEIKAIERYGGDNFESAHTWLSDIVYELKDQGKLPCES